MSSSPASGVPDKPRISTGIDGPACLICLPFSSTNARTLPTCSPARIASPTFRRPFCTSIVATGPRPLSRRDSITMPRAKPSGTAINSNSSACSNTASRSSSIPWPVCALTGINCTSPPQSSGMTSRLANSVFTRSGSASSLSTLFTATTIGTPAARAC